MDVVVEIFEPDGTTPREDYTESLGTKGDEDMVIRKLGFTILANGGCEEFSFTIYKDITTVDTVEGDIVKIKDDSGKIRFVGKIDNIDRDYSDTDTEYEDKSHVSGRGILMLADNIKYSLRESDSSTVSTNIQDLLDDLFDGGKYSGKGQDNNQPIDPAISLITFNPANNILETLAINVSYKDTLAGEIMKDVMRLNNGTLDLTSVEKYLYFLQTDGNFHTQQRVVTLLDTFDVDDGEFPTKASDDISDDGYRVNGDTSGIYNKYILNGAELTSLQYGTEVTNSRATHETITAPSLDNKNITVDEGQKWLDGFILDTLEAINTYTLRLRKRTYGFAPVWYLGDVDTPNGYIKLTEGGAGTLFQEPFLSATYSLDSSGWDIAITAGTVRPNVDVRAKILTEFKGVGKYDPISVEITDPSDTADEDTLQGVEIQDFGNFQTLWDNQDFTVTAADVEFKVKSVGRWPWGVGSTVKTLTSVSSPGVFEDPDVPGLFRVSWFNGTSGTEDISGTTIYPLGLTNETQYNMWAEITVNVEGIDKIKKSAEIPFFLTGQTTGNAKKDYNSRIPDAEKTNVVDYTPVATPMTAEQHFFTNIGGDTAPDAGAVGWFITDDSIAGSWTRMTGNFAGNLTGTTNDSFTIDSDDSSATYINIFGGTTGPGLRYDIVGTAWEVNHGAGWVSLATGATDNISRTVSAVLWRARIDSVTGDFIYENATSPTTFFRVTKTGDVKVYSDILPQTDDTFALGAVGSLFANAYIGNVTYTQDLEFSDDGGATTNAKLEWDSGEGIQFAENIGFGFMDG